MIHFSDSAYASMYRSFENRNSESVTPLFSPPLSVANPSRTELRGVFKLRVKVVDTWSYILCQEILVTHYETSRHILIILRPC
jgi:hypothetical protein